MNDFNPRCPCGQRLEQYAWDDKANISIHAARVGSDYWDDSIIVDKDVFQSTLPVWAATLYHRFKEDLL